MDRIMQKQVVTTDDLRLLAHVQHMAQTARSEPAKRAFELFLEQGKQRFYARCQAPDTAKAKTAC